MYVKDGRDGALSPLLGFIAAIGIYAVSLAVFMSFTASSPTESSTIDADLQNRAGSALDLIITDSGGAWVKTPDTMRRFGLAAGDANFLNYTAIAALRDGKIARDSTNGLPDYPEVRTALGLSDHQFHLRTYPVLISVDDANWEKMRGFNVAYIGDTTQPSSSAVLTTSTSSSGNVRIAELTILNNNTNPMIYTVSVDLEVKNNQHVSTTRQTRLLAQNEQQTISVRIHPMKQWLNEPLEVKFTTADNYGACGKAQGCSVKTVSVMPYESGAIAHETNLLVETGASYYVQGASALIKVDYYDKDGGKGIYQQDARLEVYRPSTSDPLSQEATAMFTAQCSTACDATDPPGPTGSSRMLPWQNSRKWETTCANCADRPGLWMVKVVTPSDTTRDHYAYYWVSAASLFTQRPFDPTALNEIDYIEDLVEGFDTDRYPAGDVFVDTNQEVRDIVPYIDNNPPDCTHATATYDMLIVGSNVAHNALVKISDEVGRFVDCGGTLIALGSSRGGTEWLQDVYHIALRDGAGGGISSPDPTHPLLNVPETLSWNSYSDTDFVWDISQNPGLFSHAVDGATADELMLGVSKQGALRGSVVLTGWTPGALTSPQDPAEAKRLLHNLMSQGYQMLFLDYGPEIPEGSPVGSSSRLAAVKYTALDEAPYVEVKVVLYTWRG